MGRLQNIVATLATGLQMKESNTAKSGSGPITITITGTVRSPGALVRICTCHISYSRHCFFSTLKAAQFLLLLQMAELLRKKTKPYISATRAFLYWDQQIEERATLFPEDGGVLHHFVHPVKRWKTNDDCNVYS